MNRLTMLTRRLSRHGVLGILKLIPVNIRWAWRQLKPSNIAAQRREREFDREWGIETASHLTRGQLEAEWEETKAPTGYQAVPQAIFKEMINSLPIDPASFCFIDIGSGKGRALVLAANHGFPLVIGVELSPQLHAIAETNLAKLDGSIQARVRALNLDAREFEFPGRASIIFLANPFEDAEIMRTVVRNIERAHLGSGSPVFLLYHWPVHEGVIVEHGTWREYDKGGYRKDWGFEWKSFSFMGTRPDP